MLKAFLHTEYQCLCRYNDRGAEESKFVLFTRLAMIRVYVTLPSNMYVYIYCMCLIQ